MKILYHLGRYLSLLLSFFKSPEKFSVYWNLILVEANSIGVGSVLIVVLISVFIGAVMTVQTAYQLESPLLPDSLIGTTVANSSMLELAPTVTSLVLAGKVGSSIASQLGTMRVTEQIDALEVMGINSATYLIMPKIVASLITFPLLIILSAFLMMSGFSILTRAAITRLSFRHDAAISSHRVSTRLTWPWAIIASTFFTTIS